MKNIIILCVVALSVAACANARDTRMSKGALLGGAGGALIGGVATRSAGGAIVGGAIGAAAGAVVADVTRPRHRGSRCHYSNLLGKRVCQYR